MNRREKYLGKICYYCGRKLSRRNYSIDHLKPISKGGLDISKNKVDACTRCNTEKGCLLANEFRAVMMYRAGLFKTVRWLFPGERAKRHS